MSAEQSAITVSMTEKSDGPSDEAIKGMALAVIDTESNAISALRHRLDENFVQACRYMMDCAGRIVVLGMGKSGHVGSKIAATLASTGSPAFFVHPGEASHGDLGMITDQDVVLALSNSGETDELLTILPVIRRLGVPLIALTGRHQSTLAQNATVHVDVSVEKEACPLGLAPTSSTTAALVMGDALAISILEARGFTAEDFARSHPAGMLGRRLLVHIADVMRKGERLPTVHADAFLPEVIDEMNTKGLGMTAVVDAQQKLLGVFTDGDLRRALDGRFDLHNTAVNEVMTANGKTVAPDQLAVEAARLMEDHKIHSLLVVDENQHLVGALNIHDLLDARVV
jgi:arabinose-5-phosphate isomerase